MGRSDLWAVINEDRFALFLALVALGLVAWLALRMIVG